MSKAVSFVVLLCLFICFILLLLVSLSTPIIKDLYLVVVQSNTVYSQLATPKVTEIRFGIWGFCANSVLDQPTNFTNNGECTQPDLGYQIDPAVLALTDHPVMAEEIEKTLTGVFVLHPISAGLVLLALICAVPASRSESRRYGILALLIQVIAALLITAVLAVDFTVITELMGRDGPLTGGSFDVDFGNCPWMVLGATLLIWFCVGILSAITCNCCGCGRKRDWSWRERDRSRIETL